MASFVLVHGGFHGGWCWTRVAQRLRALGHQVFTPTLTGLGERAHLLSPAVDLTTHIRDVEAVLRWERLSEVVLCGHSYGGMVITGVADRAPERISALVYLDAFVPSDGQQLMDFVPAAHHASIHADVQRNGGLCMSVPPAEVYDIADPADRAWVDALMTPQPFNCCIEPLRLAGEAAFAGRRSFVRALGYRRSLFPTFFETIRTDPTWRAEALPGGHDLMIDQPEAVAERLLRAAACHS